MNDTISAIATTEGTASIAIVRVSGKDALNIAYSITKSSNLTPRYAHLKSIYDSEDELIDRAIVIYFKAPNSFTGEDIVEFQCHGGVVIANEILQTTLKYGARLANPGEFSKRAFLNGKIDMSEAQAIAKLIETKSSDGARVLARQLKGELRDFVNSARDKIIRAIAHSEVMIDYAQEDIPQNLTEELKSQLISLQQRFISIVEISQRRRGLIEGFEVAIIGKPNVGKSSLLNAMLSYDRAIVSNIAGTTRDTIQEQLRIGSHLIRIIDTAGIREGRDEIEQIGIKRSLEAIKSADIIIALFDSSREFDNEDSKIIKLLNQLETKEIIAVLNKCDLKTEFEIEYIEYYNPIKLSTKKSIEPLIERIKLFLDTMSDTKEPILISQRQIEAVQNASNAIDEAIEPLENGELEFFSYHLKEAVESLSTITEPFRSEEVLDSMFGEFCLGK